MKTDKVIDYAYPCLRAEQAMRSLHDAALAKDWASAKTYALNVMRWAAETHSALVVMQAREEK